jgi:hypothetical protein
METTTNEEFDVDDSEILLDDEDDEGDDEPQEKESETAESLQHLQGDVESPPKELTPHQLRMQQLILKMNQARQLNRQAVQEEGSNQAGPSKRLGGGGQKDKMNPVTSLQAADDIQKAEQRADRQEAARHSMHDYHNPEAQHRQYQRSLKSVHPTTSREGSGAGDTSTFDPFSTNRSKEEERQGAHRLAQEMHRRIEKKRRNEAKKKEKEVDVAGHINKRNKQFNKKLDRNYQDQEIQQNLERGTAL